MKITEQMMQDMGYERYRILPNGFAIGVLKMTFGKGRLCLNCDNVGYNEGYCYEQFDEAVKAMNDFNPETMDEPEGWIRSIHDGRRRPDKTKQSEVIYA